MEGKGRQQEERNVRVGWYEDAERERRTLCVLRCSSILLSRLTCNLMVRMQLNTNYSPRSLLLVKPTGKRRRPSSRPSLKSRP